MAETGARIQGGSFESRNLAIQSLSIPFPPFPSILMSFPIQHRTIVSIIIDREVQGKERLSTCNQLTHTAFPTREGRIERTKLR